MEFFYSMDEKKRKKVFKDIPIFILYRISAISKRELTKNGEFSLDDSKFRSQDKFFNSSA